LKQLPSPGAVRDQISVRPRRPALRGARRSEAPGALHLVATDK
jgi:hypothetical protein